MLTSKDGSVVSTVGDSGVSTIGGASHGAGVDLAFVVDTTGSMWDDISSVQWQAKDIIDSLFIDSVGTPRVAVIGYNDPHTETLLSFSSDPEAILDAINRLSAHGGGDFPEAVNAGLLRALDGSAGEWRDNATARRIILFGDAPAKDVELREDVIRLAKNLNVDLEGELSTSEDRSSTHSPSGSVSPVEIHSIHIGDDAETGADFSDLSDETGGTISNTADAEGIVDIIFEIIDMPPELPLLVIPSIPVSPIPAVTPTPLEGQTLGSNGNDVLAGTTGDDMVFALSGNDTISGNKGNDFIDGGDDNDFITDSEGNDTLIGGAGHDTIRGGNGDDSINGLSGDDLANSGSGSDTVLGWTGDDTILGHDGQDSILAGSGNDSISGGSGDDYISGYAGNDVLYGGLGYDTMLGGDGNDRINGLHDDDMVNAGIGNDTILGWTGNDTLIGNGGDDFILSGSGDDNVLGGDGNDSIIGYNGHDVISGGNGNDVIRAGSGDDTITGGLGRDILSGETGEDTFDYNVGAESSRAAFDVIRDFEVGADKIDISDIGVFSALDTDGGLTESGEMRLTYSDFTNRTYISSDQIDFVIGLDGGDYRDTLSDTDFIY